MHIPDAARALDRDLRTLFGERLRALVVYRDADAEHETAIPTLAVVDRLTADDLRGCAGQVAAWHESGLATPLLLASREFGRSLDAFPFEFGAILADHAVVSGTDPFAGLTVDAAHLRHACEVQARGHLLHLREGFIEARGRGDRIAELIARSAAPLAALLKNVARLHGGSADDTAAASGTVERAAGLTPGSLAAVTQFTPGRLSGDEARRVFSGYLDALERLVSYVDQWSVS